MSTIKDVAHKAGVSISTVSNVLNNKSSVNIEIYNRVIRVMKELNYRPNILAMNLKKNHMGFIGVVFHELSGYSKKLLEGVLLRLEQLNYHAVVKIPRDDKIELQNTITQLIGMGVEGIILCTPHLDEKILQSIDDNMIPILMLEYCLRLPGFLTVEFDNTSLIREATELLMEQNKTVGIVTGLRRFSAEGSCWQGFVQGWKAKNGEAMFEMELPFRRGPLYKKLLTEIPKRENLPSCFIVSNEFLADCLREVLLMNGQKDHIFYVLSSQQLEKRDLPDMIMLRREVVRYAQKAVDILDRQIKEPMVNDFFEELVIPKIHVEAAIKNYYLERRALSNKRLRVLLPDVPMSTSIQLLSDAFSNQTGISLEFVKKNMTELKKEIILSCEGESQAYDVAAFHINWLSELVQKKYLNRLDEYFDYSGMEEEYLPKIQKAYFRNEYAVYGMLAEMGVQILAYRDDIFSDPVVQKQYYSKMGLELQPPRSWTEFNIVAKYFTRKYNPSSPVKYGTCIGGHTSIGLPDEFWARSLSFRGKAFREQSFGAYTPQDVKALENLCDSYQYSYPHCQTFMDNEQVRVMLDGDIAMIVTYYNYLMLNSIDWDKRIKFGRSPSNMTVIDGYLLGIPVTTRQREACSEFIQWCCSDDVALKSILLGRLTPKTNVIMNGELDYVNPGLKGVFDNLESDSFRESLLLGIGGSRSFDEVIGNKLSEAVYGGAPPDRVMRELQQMLAVS